VLELELWEERLYGQLVDVDTDLFAGLEFPSLQHELGGLADYMTRVRFDQRNLARRGDEARALSDPQIRAQVATAAADLGQAIEHNRVLLREAFVPLANTAAGGQFYATRQQQRTSERLQDTITFISVVLLVPALVAGIYGTNIRELSPDTTGRFTSLIVAMIAGAVAAALGLRAYQRRPLLPTVGRVRILLAAAGAGVAAVAMLARIAAPAGWLLLAGGLAAVAGSVGSLLRARVRGRRDNP